MMTQWNHRTAVVNGLNIHYVTYGQGSPVILLHDWPEFWYSYRQSGVPFNDVNACPKGVMFEQRHED